MKEVSVAAKLCYQSMRSRNPVYYEKFVSSCRRVGRHLSRVLNLIPPSERKIIDTPFDGSGMINIYKSMSNFCTRGRSMDQIVTKKRSQETRKLNIHLLYDDSNSMTSWWRSEYYGKTISDLNSPNTYAKIAAVSMLETFGKEADVWISFYGSRVSGPLRKRELSYRELIMKNGSGGSRLDLALEKMIKEGWYKKGGYKYVIILTDGLPEAGREQPEEDSEIQDNTISFVKKLMGYEVKFLYLPILTDPKMARKVIGSFSAGRFADEMERMGAKVARVIDPRKIADRLFFGLKALTKGLYGI